MLHAACLADPASGAAVAFVAPGGTGKTTLVRTLGPGPVVRHRRDRPSSSTTARWCPTQAAVRPARARQPLQGRDRPEQRRPGGAGGRVHLAGLCLLARDDDHDGPAVVETLATLDGVVSLVPQTSHLTDLPRPLRRLAELCESLGGVRRIRYREAADLGALWDELVGGSVMRVRRLPVTDRVDRDGESRRARRARPSSGCRRWRRCCSTAARAGPSVGVLTEQLVAGLGPSAGRRGPAPGRRGGGGQPGRPGPAGAGLTPRSSSRESDGPAAVDFGIPAAEVDRDMVQRTVRSGLGVRTTAAAPCKPPAVTLDRR